MKLGKFKKVDLREIWKHEALDFTNWLAKEENLQLLSDELGINITSPQTEVNVGKFAVDILAEDDYDHKVIIENQLEQTNHDHLGKIITYASGLGAETIIWIVSKAREEHEQAINWLNENTNDKANFFLLEIEAWKIDNSDPAPKFNIVAKPNDWTKTLRQAGGNNAISELKLSQQEFWNSVRDYGQQHAKHVKSWQKGLPQHWLNIAIGTSKANLAATTNSVKNYVGMELFIANDKDLYYKLEAKKDEIESQLGYKLDWQPLEGKKGARIIATKNGNTNDIDEQQKLIEWLVKTADDFTRVFKKYL